MKLNYFLEQQLKKHGITVTFPKDIKVRFSSLYGLDKEKEILQDIVDYFVKADKKRIYKPHTSYYISGPLGVGKASLVFAVAKESKIPVVSIDANIFRASTPNSVTRKISLLFNTARKLRNTPYKGCIVVFKNTHEVEYMNDNAVFYSSILQNIFDLDNIFIFMLAIGGLTIPAAIAEKNLFNTSLLIEYPNLVTREKIFKSCIQKQKLILAPDVSINRLAKDTIGETPLSIAYIVKEAQLYSSRKKHSSVTQRDFSEVIMNLSAGEKNLKMTENERKITAYHEAGHVIAGYFSNPDYVLKRVEISPRSQGSLGLTARDVDETKYTYFQKDFENMIIECLGGLCAEEIIFGSHTSGVVADLASATTYATSMIGAYGMDKEISPMVLLTGITDSPYARAIVEQEVQGLLKELLAKTQNIISFNRAYLEALANVLIEREVVLGNEIDEIFKKVKMKTNMESENQDSNN